jgi:hypothetical protein
VLFVIDTAPLPEYRAPPELLAQHPPCGVREKLRRKISPGDLVRRR